MILINPHVHDAYILLYYCTVCYLPVTWYSKLDLRAHVFRLHDRSLLPNPIQRGVLAPSPASRGYQQCNPRFHCWWGGSANTYMHLDLFLHIRDHQYRANSIWSVCIFVFTWIVFTFAQVPLSLSYGSISLWVWQLQTQLELQWAHQEELGVVAAGDIDGVRKIILETNPYLLAATVAVSLLHSVLNFFAFKNDVAFYNSQTDFTGISVRSLVSWSLTWLIFHKNPVRLFCYLLKCMKIIILRRHLIIIFSYAASTRCSWQHCSFFVFCFHVFTYRPLTASFNRWFCCTCSTLTLPGCCAPPARYCNTYMCTCTTWDDHLKKAKGWIY